MKNRRILLASKVREAKHIIKLNEKLQNGMKWTIYREDREKCINKYIKLFKKSAKNKHLIALIQRQIVIKKIVDNFLQWKEENRRKVSWAFIAIKMKIRFRMRFYRKMGFDFSERMRK